MIKTLEGLKESVEARLYELEYGQQPKELYEPIRYIMSLGGKRLRPLLTLLSYQLFRDNPGDAIDQAIAVELFHNFTLVHDDIMDNAPLRRGKQTVHEKWNHNTGILSGDAMIIKAYDFLIESEPSNVSEIIKSFNRCALEVCEGQQLDMNFEDRSDVKEDEYIQMIKLKTAALLGFSLELGALLAEVDHAREHLREFGINIGIGFQLKDDLLDVFGEGHKVGKQVGGDIIARKKTFLTIRAFEVAKGKDLDTLSKIYMSKNGYDPAEAVKKVTEIYHKYQIKEQSEAKMNEYFDLGFRHLKLIDSPINRKSILKSFAEKLIDRES